MNTRFEYLSQLRQRLGRPYLWGAWGEDNRNAYDCSGIVSRCLGLQNRLNVLHLADIFKANEINRMQALPGSLYFYGDDGVPYHVMTVLDHWDNGGITICGARGGDQSVTTLEIAKEKKAFVDICYGDYWLDKFLFALDPFAGDID